MICDARGWARAAELFDELAPMTRPERQQRLHGETIPRDVRRWLDELLAAHDNDRSLIIDRQIDALARSLAPEAPVLAAEEYGGQLFGPWRADAEIGRGGMGVVLTGERADGQFEMRVAIKLLDPQRVSGATVDAIRRELRLLASLEHPGIARLIDGGVRDDGLPFLVMEYVDGKPITEWAESDKPDIARRVSALIDAARAVGHCHARLVVHGDIKPGNVMVDAVGRIRLLDFGIASRISDGTERAPGGWCSPGYAAPERLRGAAPSVADDVYALGAVLYVLLTGTGIRGAREQTRIVTDCDRVAVSLPPAPSQRLAWLDRSGEARKVRGDLDAIVLRALATDPDNRYSTVVELVDDLENALSHRPVRARSGGPPYRFGRWLRRNRALATGLGLGILALLGGAGLATWQAERASRSAAIAEAARGEAETALARADSVNRFLLDLFRARIPDLPPDELPTTGQLLERGVAQARDPDSGPPAFRVELLVTLAEILTARRRLEDAETLLADARALAESSTAVEPALKLRLAVARSVVARESNRLDDAERLLQEATALYRELAPTDPMRLELDRDRARVLMRREQFNEAEQALLALRDELEDWPDQADLALRVAGDLAVIAGSTGQLELAFTRFERILGMKHALDHPPLSLATTEINLAELARLEFRYDEAVRRYHGVIERLAPFTDVPRAVRATTFTGLHTIARIRGDFERAELWLQRGADEWARVLDLPSPDADFYIHAQSGRLAHEQGQYDEAAGHLATAIERMSHTQEAPPHRVGLLHADRARALCRAGRLQEADAALTRAAERPGDVVRLAENHARAVCALIRAPDRVDPAWISPAHLEHTMRSSGDASLIARLELLRADLLERNGDAAEAESLRSSARARLKAADVRANHPLWLAFDP